MGIVFRCVFPDAKDRAVGNMIRDLIRIDFAKYPFIDLRATLIAFDPEKMLTFDLVACWFCYHGGKDTIFPKEMSKTPTLYPF